METSRVREIPTERSLTCGSRPSHYNEQSNMYLGMQFICNYCMQGGMGRQQWPSPSQPPRAVDDNHEYQTNGVNIDKISIGVRRTPTDRQRMALLGGRYIHCEHRLDMQDDNSSEPFASRMIICNESKVAIHRVSSYPKLSP
jgi:hypothetical protein